MPRILQVTTTLGSREEAERVGRTLVEERLSACAQVVGPVTSYFWWEERVESATEWYCYLKTTSERYSTLEARLQALHPYQVAEVIALPVERVSTEYANWVTRSVSPTGA